MCILSDLVYSCLSSVSPLALPAHPGLLTTFAVFRPKLLLRDELVHVTLDLADLTAAEKSRCIAVEARWGRGTGL